MPFTHMVGLFILSLGFSIPDVTSKGGVRQSAAEAYLRPTLNRQKNIHLLTDAHVVKVTESGAGRKQRMEKTGTECKREIEKTGIASRRGIENSLKINELRKS